MNKKPLGRQVQVMEASNTDRRDPDSPNSNLNRMAAPNAAGNLNSTRQLTMTTPSDSEHLGQMNNLQDEELISDIEGQPTMDKKLNFEEIDQRYQNKNREMNLDQEYMQMAMQEDPPKKMKAPKLQPMTNDKFIEKISQNINYHSQFFHYDTETKTTFAFPSQQEDPSTVMKHSTTCLCSVCQMLTREMRQTKNHFNAMREKEEIEFSKFIQKEINPKNGRLITEMLEDLKDEWRRKYKLPTDLKRYQESLKGQFVFEKKEFTWLVEKMLSNNERIYGCEVNIPETVIMEGGVPKLYVKTDKNGVIVTNNKPKCNSLMFLQGYFTRLYTERKRQNTLAMQQVGGDGKSLKESSRLRAQMSKMDQTNLTTGSSKLHNSPHRMRTDGMGGLGEVDEDSLEQVMSNGNSVGNLRQNSYGYNPVKSNVSALQQNQPRKPKQPVEKNPLTQVFNRDLVLIRYIENVANIQSLHQFNSDFQRYRETNNYWQTINSIQLAPNCKIGLGKYFSFTFSPIFYDEKVTDQFTLPDKLPPIQDFMPEVVASVSQKMRGQILYDYQQYGSEDKVLMVNNPAAFCLKQCNKICYYLQLVHKIDVVRMKVEFFQDESGFIQFYNASNIWTRKDLYREATETFPKPIDITQIMQFQEKVNHIEQLKNLHFEKVLEKVISDLVHQFRSNRGDEIGAKSENRLFDFISDFTKKIQEVNDMKTDKLVEKIVEHRLKQETNQPRHKINRKHSSILINSQSFTASERQKSLADASKSNTNLSAVSHSRQAGQNKQKAKQEQQEDKPSNADLQMLIAFQIQKIGILGQPTNVYAEYHDDLEKFKRHIKELQLSKNSGYTIKFSDDEQPQAQGYQKINMLEWLRQQKELEKLQLEAEDRLVLKEVGTATETSNVKVVESNRALISHQSEEEAQLDKVKVDYNSEVVAQKQLQLSDMVAAQKQTNQHVHSSVNPRILQSRVINKQMQLQKKVPPIGTGSMTMIQTGQDSNIETNGEDPYQNRGAISKSVHVQGQNSGNFGVRGEMSRQTKRKQSNQGNREELRTGSESMSRISTKQLAKRINPERLKNQKPEVLTDGVYQEQLSKRQVTEPSPAEVTFADNLESKETRTVVFQTKSTIDNSRAQIASSQLLIPSSNLTQLNNLQISSLENKDLIRATMCKSVDKTKKEINTPKQTKKKPSKCNAISQIKLIQNKIKKSKDTMSRQIVSAAGQGGLKLNQKFKGWKGLGEISSDEEPQTDLKDLKIEMQTLDIRNPKRATFEDLASSLAKDSPGSQTNKFIKQVKKSKFEFENNRMMDEKLRNITEMGMVESLENNMFGFHSKQRCMSQENMSDRLVYNQIKTKQRLIENIQKAVETEIKNEEIVSFHNETQSKRTGLTDYKHLTNRGPEGQVDKGSTNGFTENLSSLNALMPQMKVSHSAIPSKLSGKFQGELSEIPSYPGEPGDMSFKNTLNLKDLPGKSIMPFSSLMEPPSNYLPPINQSQMGKNIATQLKQIPIKNNRNDGPQLLKNSQSQQMLVPDIKIKQSSTNMTLKPMKAAPKSLLFATEQEVKRTEPELVNQLYSLRRDIIDNKLLYAYPDDHPQERIHALQRKFEIDAKPQAKKAYGFFKNQQLNNKGQPKIVDHITDESYHQREPSEHRVSTLTTIQLHKDSRQSQRQI